ncbi:TPA: 16S rRNA (guanine(527)-N(7))-methyltransferase RsmG [Streptococcus suis]
MDTLEFRQALLDHGIDLTDQQMAQFETYYQHLVEWNEKINLTAITDKKEVYLKHFYDSLMVLWHMPLESYHVRLVDVGAGAGFPSIPLKIVKPELEVTIVDSLNKRIVFLQDLVETLGLDNVTCVHGRAEEVGQNPVYRGQFDVATARAVAALNVLSEFCLPLVKKSGYFIALKAAKTDTEIEEAQKAISTLGAKLETVASAHLPIEGSERTYIKIKKTLDTPKQYPRKAGKPAKQPIR